MDNPATLSTNTASAPAGVVVARKAIAAARTRDAQPSDGGGTGRSDGND